MRSRRSLRVFAVSTAAAFGLTIALFAPREARAFERQFHIGAEAGYAALVNGAGATLHGFGGGVRLTYGVSDTVNALAIVDVSVHPATTYHGLPVDGQVLAGGALGLAYVVDILQWIPWVGATAGAYYSAGPTDSGPRLALGIPFGLDYQLSRSIVLGAAGEYKLFLLDPTGAEHRISAFLRAEYIWGY